MISPKHAGILEPSCLAKRHVVSGTGPPIRLGSIGATRGIGNHWTDGHSLYRPDSALEGESRVRRRTPQGSYAR